MEYGVVLPHFRDIASPQAVQRVAREAEAMGYHSLWVTDHLVIPHRYTGRFGQVFYEMLTVLAYVVPLTRRVRLGTSALILPYRNPVFMAKALATVDVLSGGRLIVGAAAGWCREEFQALGVPFERRGDLADESLRVFKALWTQEEPVFHGAFWHIEGVKALPRPLQRPHPPIWVGGNSPRARRRAVELGDAWHPTRPTPEEVRQGREHLQRLAERSGRDLSRFPIAVRQPLRIAPQDSPRPLVGPLDSVRRGVEAFREAGASHLVLDTFYSAPEVEGVSLDEALKSLEAFARAVLGA